MLQMASVYGVQQTAKQAPGFFVPKCAEVGDDAVLEVLGESPPPPPPRLVSLMD